MSDYSDLVNIEEFWEKRENFNPERGDISFYCKDCSQIVETDREKPRSYIFICKLCKGKNVAIGTESGLKENYERKRF